MKKILIIAVVVVLTLALSLSIGAKSKDCVTIQDGVLTYSAGHYLGGEPLMVGYDLYGYNYQAHMFKGSYANSYLGKDGFPPYEGDSEAYLAENPAAEATWYWPYRDVKLMMKWSDEWLSNKDCNRDGKLDRGYKCDPVNANNSGCEGAWLTNHQSGTDVDADGNEYKWTYFVKIVAAPTDAEKVDGIWYAADGTEIGPVIWGSFAIVQQVENDAGAGLHGVQYLSPSGPGFGHFK